MYILSLETNSKVFLSVCNQRHQSYVLHLWSTNKFSSDISVLRQRLYSALTVLIQFSCFILLFRVLVHAKIFSLQTAEPSVSQKNHQPF